MSSFPQPESAPRQPSGSEVGSPGSAKSAVNGDYVLEGHELEAALQLLVERAQYITGATGAALALTQGEEMVCRASVGSCPAIGARLQVRSGLTGESMSRKQLLRCDNAEADGRVNLETCRQLGIASIVVAPLLTREGEVRGLFELVSDHAYAFEERDLIALERMASLSLTAIDLAEKRRLPISTPEPSPAKTPSGLVAVPVVSPTEVPDGLATTAPPESSEKIEAERPGDLATAAPPEPSEKIEAEGVPAPAPGPLGSALVHAVLHDEPGPPRSVPVPEAMSRVQKCTSCGFPVSEGRTLCLDCEGKRQGQVGTSESAPSAFVPAFVADSPPPDESWLANHVNVLAVLVLVLSIVVAVVVFR